MEANELDFKVGDILSAEEADEMFRQQDLENPDGDEDIENAHQDNDDDEDNNDDPEEGKEKEKEKQPAEGEDHDPDPEKVGEEDIEKGTDAVDPTKDDGSSPSAYSSIAKALVNDGIFSDFDDIDLDKINTPEDFADLFERTISAKMEERNRRVFEALNDGVKPDEVRQYENTIEQLNSIDDEDINDEGEDGEKLRRFLIFNECIIRGYTEERAKKEVEKSFKSESDVDDAKDALESLKAHYTKGYDDLRNAAKQRVEEKKKEQKANMEKFRKMILEDELKLGETTLDKKTSQKIFDAVTKPVYKDPKTKRLLTAIQKFQMENPLEYAKQLGMWFVLTDGGKSTEKLNKEQLRKEKNKGIRELERKINSSSISPDGSLRYASGKSGAGDTLLSGDWDVPM